MTIYHDFVLKTLWKLEVPQTPKHQNIIHKRTIVRLPINQSDHLNSNVQTRLQRDWSLHCKQHSRHNVGVGSVNYIGEISGKPSGEYINSPIFPTTTTELKKSSWPARTKYLLKGMKNLLKTDVKLMFNWYKLVAEKETVKWHHHATPKTNKILNSPKHKM